MSHANETTRVSIHVLRVTHLFPIDPMHGRNTSLKRLHCFTNVYCLKFYQRIMSSKGCLPGAETLE
eukprot:scaffold288184_cov35-Prasinocladus_malaysianus.AAC.1